jgi:hypothetical protein
MRLMLTNMKNSLVFLALLCINSAFGQVTDAFNDGDFTAGPIWTGSNAGADFIISDQPGLNHLRSNSVVLNSNFYLSTVNSLANDCAWEFWCNLQLFTSGSNYVDVYLISDQQNLQSASINGYFVRIGNTADEVALYKRTGAVNTSIKIIDGLDGTINTSNNTVKIKVSRTAAGLFTLERDLTGVGFDYFPEGSVLDNSIISTSYFGFLVQQSTISFVQKHFFDDIVISPLIADITPPNILSATPIDTNTIAIAYNEPMDSVKAKNTANYTLDNGFGNPISIKKLANSASYELKFASNLQTATYLLSIINVNDKAGNVVSNSPFSFSYVKPYAVQAKDILINEIFADPSPQIDLPSVEFTELWNTTDFPISINNWNYSDGTSTATLGNISIDPHEFVVLCALADVPNFTLFGKVIGLSTWPSLNNASDKLVLKNDKGGIIDQVNYADTWYKDALKKQGGYSLELINPKAICTGIQNWGASMDISGGTPGKINSIYQAGINPAPLKLLSVNVLDSVTLSLQFNRFIDSTSAVFPSHYNLNNGVGQPISGIAIGPNFTEVQLKFAAKLSRGLTYTLSSNQVSDCSGVLIQVPNNSGDFYLPQKILVGDLLISEILFNPKVGGVDFVEIYNNTDHPLDLKDLSIASADDQDKLINLKAVSGVNNLIPAKSYRVFATDTDNILANYTVSQSNTLIKVAALPSFNDDAGVVMLVRDSIRIDQFNYSDKMHFPLLSNTEGVSLERSLFSVAANTSGNFRSAAAAVGFATPGYQNSQFLEGVLGTNEINLSSATVSPDNDGFEDALTLQYHWQMPGGVANVRIFTEQGQLVRNLIKNQTMGTEGAWVWDGLNDQAERVPIGIYILKIQVFNTGGNVKNYTKTCVVATKLN